MARRRLEAAIQAGKDMNVQENSTERFSTVKLKQEIHLSREHRGIYSLQFNYDGTQLAVGFGSGCIQVEFYLNKY